jgi:hypothetical protein
VISVSTVLSRVSEADYVPKIRLPAVQSFFGDMIVAILGFEGVTDREIIRESRCFGRPE